MRADRPDIDRAEELLDPAVHRSDVGVAEEPARHARLVRDHADRDAVPAQERRRVAGGGHRLDARRVAVVGHIPDERAVTVEQHRAWRPNHHTGFDTHFSFS